MSLISTIISDCPYCGEKIELVVDASIHEQRYIEDCEVCCRPINININVDIQGDIQLTVSDENSC